MELEEENVTESENPAEVEEKKEIIEEGEKAEKPKKPWYEKRFDRFTAQNQQLSRTNAELLEEIANLKSGKDEDGSKTKIPQAELDRMVDERAQQLVLQREFNDKCNSIYEDGNEKWGDFDTALKSLGTMGLMTPTFLELVTDLDKSDELLYYLGNNHEEADRIQSLAPAKQALALAKIENSLGKEKKEEEVKETKTSKAPPPVKPIETSKAKGNAGWATKYYDGMSQDEFNEWDDKTSKKKSR